MNLKYKYMSDIPNYVANSPIILVIFHSLFIVLVKVLERNRSNI